MFAKIKSSNFIDVLQFELNNHKDSSLKAVIKDDQGSICSSMERKIPGGQQQINWTGLDNLPYGHYTLELSHGEEEMKMKLVKRI